MKPQRMNPRAAHAVVATQSVSVISLLATHVARRLRHKRRMLGFEQRPEKQRDIW